MLLVALGGLCTSCTSDDDDLSSSQIVGTWYGTRSYYNPVGGTKYQYLTMTFNASGRGYLEYEAPNSFSAASFDYEVHGSKIVCEGVRGYDEGEIEYDFTMTLEIEDDRLIPLDKYSNFILTKDNSVVIDESGSELIDQSQQLQQIWVEEKGNEVIILKNNGKYEEYILSAPFSTTYTRNYSGYYSYDSIKQTITFGKATWSIKALDDYNLVISQGDTTLRYKKGDFSDIPNDFNLKGYLTSGRVWDSGKHTFVFYDDGFVQYSLSSDVFIGSYGRSILSAKGKFIVSGNTIICDYENVRWDGSEYSEYQNLFPGWVANKPCSREYEVKVVSDKILHITMPDGKTLSFKPRH